MSASDPLDEDVTATERDDGTVPAWLVLFDCGHTRHPDACHCNGDDEGHAPHDGPPRPGWAGWCVECADFRTTVECIEADPIGGGHTVAMWAARRVIADALRGTTDG